jgi:hypothetical protein
MTVAIWPRDGHVPSPGPRPAGADSTWPGGIIIGDQRTALYLKADGRPATRRSAGRRTERRGSGGGGRLQELTKR